TRPSSDRCRCTPSSSSSQPGTGRSAGFDTVGRYGVAAGASSAMAVATARQQATTMHLSAEAFRDVMASLRVRCHPEPVFDELAYGRRRAGAEFAELDAQHMGFPANRVMPHRSADDERDLALADGQVKLQLDFGSGRERRRIENRRAALADVDKLDVRLRCIADA